jgi:polygalacturonase
MKRFLTLVLITILSVIPLLAQKEKKSAGKIIESIITTTFPSDTFNIIALGAINNGVNDNRAIIQDAINECSSRGGGTVLIPEGVFFCKGPVNLKSNLNLHISADAVLRFSPEPGDYLPAVLTRWEGIDIYNYSPMIYTANQENIAISGKGVIDGNAQKIWASYRKLISKSQGRMRDLNDKQVPVAERLFGEGDFLRPSFIQFLNCKRIRVEGVTLVNSPLWMLHPVYCSDIIIRNVDFNSLLINNDGIDFDSSNNGLVENCTFRTGDDAVVFKSGRDKDGWRVNKPTKNIVVRNCSAPQTLHGIAFGSEMSGGIENVYIENFTMGKVESEAIQFKANKDRGGYIRNIYIRNVEVDSAGAHLFFFTNGYHGYRGGNAPSEFSHISINTVKCNYAKHVLQLQGLPESPLHHISIKNVDVQKADKPFDKKEFYKKVSLKNIRINNSELNQKL